MGRNEGERVAFCAIRFSERTWIDATPGVVIGDGEVSRTADHYSLQRYFSCLPMARD